MRMRAGDVQQAPRQASPGPAVVPATVDAMAVVVLTTVTVLMTVIVAVSTVVVVLVVVMRTARAFHDIQHARINALPHLDKYQRRAVANWPQLHQGNYPRSLHPGQRIGFNLRTAGRVFVPLEPGIDRLQFGPGLEPPVVGREPDQGEQVDVVNRDRRRL